MLVRITNNCTMGCNHCMVDASENGKHMDFEIFKEVLKFNKQYDPMILLISGGEPTEHPHFLEMLEHLKMYNNNVGRVLILSNGLFLYDKIFTDCVLSAGIEFQITHDTRYYKKPIKIIKHKLLTYTYELKMLSPFGRAIKNNLKCNRESPLCYNLRALTITKKTFKDIIFYMRAVFKFCTPSININGSISMGETNFCKTFGTVFDNDETLYKNLCTSHCENCGLYNKLDNKYKLIWKYLKQKK